MVRSVRICIAPNSPAGCYTVDEEYPTMRVLYTGNDIGKVIAAIRQGDAALDEPGEEAELSAERDVKHYTISEWTDYVRHLSPAAAAGRMKEHLESGCRSCTETVQRLEKLVAVIAADTSLEVPDYVVHNAKSIFALRQPEKTKLATLVARLVYDSFRQPLPSGVRSRQRSSRHAVYQAGDVCVDVRLDRADSGKVHLVGQVAECKVPANAIADVRVSLMAGRRTIAQTISNQNGEFAFEYQAERQLRLHVPVDAKGKAIEVRLYELSGGGSADMLAGEESAV